MSLITVCEIQNCVAYSVSHSLITKRKFRYELLVEIIKKLLKNLKNLKKTINKIWRRKKLNNEKSSHPSLGEELTVGDQNQGGGDNKNLHPIDTVEISYFTFNSIKIFELKMLAPDSYWTDTRKCILGQDVNILVKRLNDFI